MGVRVEVKDIGVVDKHTDMGDTVCDAVHQALEGAWGACCAQRRAEPLEEPLRSTAGGEVDGCGIYECAEDFTGA